MRNGHDRPTVLETFERANVGHVLVASNLEHRDRDVLRMGLQFAGAHRAKVTVLHVVSPEPTGNPMHWLDAIESLNRAFHGDEGSSQARSRLEQAQADLEAFLDLVIPKSRRGSFDVSGVCRVGEVAAEIGRFANEQDVDLVVLGSRGATSWRFWPSQSQRIVQATKKPVVLVRPDAVSPALAPRLAVT